MCWEQVIQYCPNIRTPGNYLIRNLNRSQDVLPSDLYIAGDDLEEVTTDPQCGGYGEVRTVKHREKGVLYAVKKPRRLESGVTKDHLMASRVFMDSSACR